MPLLLCRGLVKLFGHLVAVDGVDLAVEPGEIVGLIGPNGAGKSTLVNLITGMEIPTAGTLVFEGCDLTRLRPASVARLGISRTFQIAQPFHEMTVCQNVAVPVLFRAGRAARVSDALREADAVLETVGLRTKRDLPARALTTPDLRRLELAKALALRPRLMLLDEVMAGLTPAEVDEAMDLLRRINAQGIALLVIEHVLRAVMGLSHRVVVLHHGRKIAEGSPPQVTSDPAVIEAYLGTASEQRRCAPSCEPRRRRHGGSLPPAPLLHVAHLDAGYGAVQVLWNVSLEVFPGEVVALIGPNGAGKSTLLRTISGLVRPYGGIVTFAGHEIGGRPPEEIVRLGMAHVPQGRRLFGDLSVRDNLLLGGYARADRAGMTSDLDRVLELFPALRARLALPASQLSGGEQQMTALGRALMARPRLLLIDEPSLGLAPIAVASLMEVVGRLRAEGTSVLLVEQDVAVALEHADRGYVLEMGRVDLEGAAEALLGSPQIQAAYLGLSLPGSAPPP